MEERVSDFRYAGIDEPCGSQRARRQRDESTGGRFGVELAKPFKHL